MNPLVTGIIAGSYSRVPAFSPTDIAGLIVWLDAGAGVFSDAGTTPAVNDDTIQQWNDQSGNGNNASQGTSANRPTYKTGVLNSRPVLRFDGSNDSIRTGTFSSTLSQPNTVFIVASTNTANMTFIDGLGTSNRHQFQSASTPSVSAFAGGTMSFSRTATFTHRLFTIRYNTSSSQILENGTSVATGDVGTHSLTGLNVGSRFSQDQAFLNGDFAEILIYDTDLSTGNREAVEAYLISKYNLS